MLNISIVVGRKPSFFFWNAVLPFFLFVILSFVSLIKTGLSLGDKAQITLPMVRCCCSAALFDHRSSDRCYRQCGP